MVRLSSSDQWKVSYDEQEVALDKQNVRAACPKGQAGIRVFFSSPEKGDQLGVCCIISKIKT